MTSSIIPRLYPVRHTWTQVPPGNKNVDSKVFEWIDSRVGDDLPDWKERIAAGKPANNNYNCYEAVVAECIAADLEVVRCGESGTVYGTETSTGFHPNWMVIGIDSISQSTVNEAYTRFNKRVEEFIAPFQGATFLGELKESVAMIKHRTKSVLGGMIGYRNTFAKRAKAIRNQRRNSTLTRNLLKEISDAWLEYSFGWSPLFGDIESAATVLMTNKSMQKRVTGKSESTNSVVTDLTHSGFPFPNYCTIASSRKVTTRSMSRVVGLVDIRLTSSAEGSTLQTWGLTGRNFVPTLWELTPYSFLADYFTNIGDIIGAAFIERKALAWLSQTNKVQQRNEWATRLVGLYIGVYDYALIGANPILPRCVVLTRSLSRFTPAHTIPSLEYTIPDLGSTQYANMVALLLSRLNV